jgi:biopolymer transport protein ExbD
VATRGFLIRFIDIGLIVLFGFLMISEIEASTRVELADPVAENEELEAQEDEERGILVVDIAPDGVFLLSEPRVGEGVVSLEGVVALTAALRSRAAAHDTENLETVVMIQPHEASWVQFTVDVMDVCDRLSLTKSLRMDIEVAPPPAQEGM